MAVTLLIFIGVPAAGKTYTAKKIIADCTLSQQFQFFHINYDSLIPRRDYQALSPLQWKMDRLQLFHEVKEFLTELLEKGETCWRGEAKNLKNGRLVLLIDDNMYYRSMRRSFYQLAQALTCGFCQLYFKCSIAQAIEANASRVGLDKVRDETIKKMFENMDSPKGDCHWERKTLTVTRETSSLTKSLSSLLENCFEFPESYPELPVNTVQPLASVLQNVDLVLRKFVGQLVRECKDVFSPTDFREFTRKMTQHKSEFLDHVKKGIIEIALDTNSSLIEDEFVLFAFDTFKHHPNFNAVPIKL